MQARANLMAAVGEGILGEGILPYVLNGPIYLF